MAASAAEEAMAMILRLQSEKNTMEIRSITMNAENAFRVCNAFTYLAYAKLKALNR